eukprot:8713520-Lingulodinium_polyedra.AAC.1
MPIPTLASFCPCDGRMIMQKISNGRLHGGAALLLCILFNSSFRPTMSSPASLPTSGLQALSLGAVS